ncbi:MAG TPA: TrkA family potassium uptake protein [Chromatiales bacterium]|nr:TrkA family potassium uptake protein [Chromatiales bacterium]
MERPTTLIFGCGALGQEVASHLQQRVPGLLMISNTQERVDEVLEKGFVAERADYTSDDVLRSLGIGEWVERVYCLFPEESKNVFLTISARALDPDLTIICAAESPQSIQKLTAAGASKVIDTYEMVGRKIHELTCRPLVVQTLERVVFGQADLETAEITIPSNSPLSSKRLNELRLDEHYDIVLLGVVDLEMGDKLIFNTRGLNHRLDPGDILVVIGPAQEIYRLRRDVSAQEAE